MLDIRLRRTRGESRIEANEVIAFCEFWYLRVWQGVGRRDCAGNGLPGRAAVAPAGVTDDGRD